MPCGGHVSPGRQFPAMVVIRIAIVGAAVALVGVTLRSRVAADRVVVYADGFEFRLWCHLGWL